MKEKNIGVIYTIPEKLANRIFNKKKNVFVKFLPKRVKKINLDINSKILISISKSNKKVLGESIIRKIEFLTKTNLLKKYKNKIFLNKKELKSYCLMREDRKLLVLSLDRIKKYKNNKFSKNHINMGGKYLTKKEYLEIIKGKNK